MNSRALESDSIERFRTFILIAESRNGVRLCVADSWKPQIRCDVKGVHTVHKSWKYHVAWVDSSSPQSVRYFSDLCDVFWGKETPVARWD